MTLIVFRLLLLWGAVYAGVVTDNHGVSFFAGGVAMFAIMLRPRRLA